MIAGRDECGKVSAILFHVIKMAVMISASYGSSTFRCEAKLAIRSLQILFCAIKLSMLERIQSEMTEYILGFLFEECRKKNFRNV